jgi:hypothetical protein
MHRKLGAGWDGGYTTGYNLKKTIDESETAVTRKR